MMKKRLAIAAGGDSGEYEISIKSAGVVAQHVDRDLYEPYVILIRGTEWIWTSPGGEKIAVDKDDFSISLDQEKITFDIVFIAVHGTPGEDGKLQGYLDMLGIPYTSCGQPTSTVTFNKYFCNHIVSSLGIKVAPSVLIRIGEKVSIEEVLSVTGLPCFVKPNQGGSSVGISRVNAIHQLQPAIEKAFKEDDQVLVEGYIPGREITCGVVVRDGKVRSLPLTEIVSKNEFFDFEAKYTDGMAEEITPAPVPSEIETKCRKLSEKLYKSLICKGFVRFDYIFNEEGIFFLEVNTVPGLSPNSIIPKQAREAGISLKDLFGDAIEQALQ